MKKFFFLLAFAFVGQQAFSQMYIITEKYDGNVSTQPTFDSVFVTDPTGVTVSYSIPHQLINISEHNAQLSQIINNVISLGYKIISVTQPEGVVNNSLPDPHYALKTIYLSVPWTSIGLEEVTQTLKNLNIHPNPANEFIDIVLDYDIKSSSEIVIYSEAGYIYHKQKISKLYENELYRLDISRVPAGKYFITIVDDKSYTTAQKLIII